MCVFLHILLHHVVGEVAVNLHSLKDAIITNICTKLGAVSPCVNAQPNCISVVPRYAKESVSTRINVQSACISDTLWFLGTPRQMH